MTQKELDILTNIIGAVETGGQIYGKRRYECYVPPYHNSSAEHTCTLGWAGNYGARARKLCQMIFDKNPTEFRKADSANIEKKLKVDWVATKWNPSSSEKTALIAIITTNTGKECQDKLFQESVQSYIKNAEAFGVTSVKAQMMWCEIEHLGGLKSVKRIFQRASKPYTPESIFASLLLDQKDSSSSNQVGDKKFQTRHECCVKWINQYVTGSQKENDTMELNVNKVIEIALAEVGYLEKRSNSSLDSKTQNAGSANYTKYGRDMHNLYPSYMDFPAAWCDCFVDWCFYKAYGKTNAMKLLGGKFDDYTVNSAQLYKNKGAWYTSNPKVGDQIFFKNSSRICHTGLVYKVTSTTVYTIEGNTSGASGVVANGGGVCKKSYALNYSRIAGYGRPAYDKIFSSTPSSSSVTLKKGSTGSAVKTMQKMLIACGYTCGSAGADGDFGDSTCKALKAFQKDSHLEVDEIYGSASKKALEAEYNATEQVVRDAITWAIGIVEDPKHGYDQTNRWSPDYDCSSFVIMAYENAGIKVKSAGATYTKNMESGFTKCGFQNVASTVALKTGKGLVRGDVLLKAGYHTALYIGNDKIAHASLNENGQITGGKTGDQANEIRIQQYFFDNWDTVLRYEKAKETTSATKPTNNVAKGQKWLNANYEELLKSACGAKLVCDGDYGSKTRNACLAVWKDVVNRKYGSKLTPSNTNFGNSCLQAAKKATLRKGDSGTLPYILNMILYAKGFYKGEASSTFNIKTKEAVIAFQKSKGLSQDGICGQKTWQKIFS